MNAKGNIAILYRKIGRASASAMARSARRRYTGILAIGRPERIWKGEVAELVRREAGSGGEANRKT
jgi:hypothetical protein